MSRKTEEILTGILIAVRAAEQSLKDETGEFKKSEVLSFVCKWLEDNGVKIDMEQLDKLIECAVYTMKQEG